jgi:hypothetical protein
MYAQYRVLAQKWGQGICDEPMTTLLRSREIPSF